MPMIQFKQCAVENVAMSQQQGRQVFEDGVEALITISPRSTLSYSFPLRRENESKADFMERLPLEIRLRWMDHLRAYLDGVEMCDGTPLTAMNWITPGVIETLRSAGVSSVEALAKIGEGIVEPYGLDGRDLKQKAKNWLADKSGQAVAQLQRQEDEIALLKEERGQMMDTLKQMQAELAALKEKKGRGKTAEE